MKRIADLSSKTSAIACALGLAAFAAVATANAEPVAQRDTLLDYGFVGIESQRDAAHQILTIYAAAGQNNVQAPGAQLVATFLRMFSGGARPSGDVIKIVTPTAPEDASAQTESEMIR